MITRASYHRDVITLALTFRRILAHQPTTIFTPNNYNTHGHRRSCSDSNPSLPRPWKARKGNHRGGGRGAARPAPGAQPKTHQEAANTQDHEDMAIRWICATPPSRNKQNECTFCKEPQTATVVTSLGSSQPSAAAAFDTASTGMPMVFKMLGMMEETLLLSSATNPDSLTPSPPCPALALSPEETATCGCSRDDLECLVEAVVPVKTSAKVIVPVKTTAVVVKPTVPVKTTAKGHFTDESQSTSRFSCVAHDFAAFVSLESYASTLPTTSSALPSSSTTSLPAATKAPAVKSAPKPSSSPSPSPSTTPSSAASASTIAAAIVSGIVGLAIVELLVAFVLRQWNRQRRARARESIVNFDAKTFRRSAHLLDDPSSPLPPPNTRFGGNSSRASLHSVYSSQSAHTTVAAYNPYLYGTGLNASVMPAVAVASPVTRGAFTVMATRAAMTVPATVRYLMPTMRHTAIIGTRVPWHP
ncbi:hypothetical protein C8F01DRAFT_1266608 [Mycena amicta]|nr:hypothetical protein C8F01DRAFT_1266608 [Mycena amicta]